MPTRGWSIGCSRRRDTASAGPGAGSTSPATPTRKASASRTSPAARLALPRLRHPRLQRRQAVRPLPARTARGRRAGRLRERPRRSRRNSTTTWSRPAFLRMAPDGTWANITDYVPDRLEVIADEIDVLGSAVLGLTMKCARCHGHKFDPIPQRDYYRLTAVFKGAYDEYDWLKPDLRPGLAPISQDVLPGRMLPHVTTAERRAWEARDAKSQTEIDAIKAPHRPEGGGAHREVPRGAAREVACGVARRPEEDARDRTGQAQRGPALSRREVRERAADRPRCSEGSRRRVQEGSGRGRRPRPGAGKPADAGAEDPGALGPRRAVADLHLPSRRPDESGAAGRAGRALRAHRRQDAVRSESAVAGGEEDRPPARVRTLADATGPPADGPRRW